MFGIHDFALFVLAGILLNLTPGPDTLYVVARSSAQGLRAGMIAALGVGSGCFVHIFAAAVGLSALIVTSAVAFNVVRYAGAAYLVYLGVMTLRGAGAAPLDTRTALVDTGTALAGTGAAPLDTGTALAGTATAPLGTATAPMRPAVAARGPADPWRIYSQGLLTNALNPKVALFFLAFLPQFIVPSAPHKALAFLLLGLVFDINGTTWLMIVAALTSGVARRAAWLAPLRVWWERAIGVLFVGLGLRLVWQQ